MKEVRETVIACIYVITVIIVFNYYMGMETTNLRGCL